MYMRYRVSVWNSGAIERAVVTTGTPVTRSLRWHHAKRSGPCTGGGADDAELEHVLKFPLSSFEAVRCETSGTG